MKKEMLLLMSNNPHHYLVDPFYKVYIPEKNNLDASTLQKRNDHYQATYLCCLTFFLIIFLDVKARIHHHQ